MTIKEFKIQLALGTLTYDMKLKLTYYDNPNTPVEILTILSTDEYWLVRCRVAENPNTPKEVLTILSADKDYGVRCSVAKNPNTPKEALTKLSTDKSSDVRYRVAVNLNTPTKKKQIDWRKLNGY